jgi:hypothetical protein
MIVAFTGAEWDTLNAMPDPDAPFRMTCDEGHETVVTHRAWHSGSRWPCADRACPGEIDLAHARRHVSCPCDEASTEPQPADSASAGGTPTAPAPGDLGYRFPSFIR